MIRVLFRTSKSVKELAIRECECTFCTRQGAQYTSDPNGQLEIYLTNEAALNPYRFGLGTADFLSCIHCGVFVAATWQDSEQRYSVLNVRSLDDFEQLNEPSGSKDFDAETKEERHARRSRNWTPTRIVYEPT